MRKSYEATTREEVKAIIIQIIIEKVREITGDKPLRIKVKDDFNGRPCKKDSIVIKKL